MTPDSADVKAGFPAAVSETRWQPWRLVIVFAVLIFGVWTSLRYSFGNWSPDADIAAQVAIWQGISQYGLAFLKTWRFTQDNWLLSLTPITWLVYTVVGTSPKVVVGVGWLIFAASVGLTTFLANAVAGRKAAYPVALILLFPNFVSFGPAGFLSYPVTHNVSMAWAILALVLAHRALVRGSIVFAALAGASVFIDTTSDPWAGPAIALPLILASAAVALWNWRRREGWHSGALCACAVIGFWAARTKLFGMLKFLPSSPFQTADADGLVSNTGWMVRVIAIMFNILPFADTDYPPFIVFNFVAFAAVLVGGGVLAIRGLRATPVAEQLIVGVSILSLSGISVAFLLYQGGTTTMIAGRFFPNLRYFGALLVGIAVVRHWANLLLPVRAAYVGYSLLLVASGLASAPGLWTGKTPILTAENVTDLGAFLQKNGLHYGYGEYWGAQALAMNWMTEGRVTIRPVMFDRDANRVNGRHAQTSRLFYAPGLDPPGTQETFLVINDDGENCPVVDACVAMAIRQFGAPSRRLELDDMVVLVWPYPIAAKIIDY